MGCAVCGCRRETQRWSFARSRASCILPNAWRSAGVIPTQGPRPPHLAAAGDGDSMPGPLFPPPWLASGPLVACPLQDCNTADGLKDARAGKLGTEEGGWPGASLRHGFLGPKARRRSTRHRDPKPRALSSPAPRVPGLSQSPGIERQAHQLPSACGRTIGASGSGRPREDGWEGRP